MASCSSNSAILFLFFSSSSKALSISFSSLAAVFVASDLTAFSCFSCSILSLLDCRSLAILSCCAFFSSLLISLIAVSLTLFKFNSEVNFCKLSNCAFPSKEFKSVICFLIVEMLCCISCLSKSILLRALSLSSEDKDINPGLISATLEVKSLADKGAVYLEISLVLATLSSFTNILRASSYCFLILVNLFISAFNCSTSNSVSGVLNISYSFSAIFNLALVLAISCLLALITLVLASVLILRNVSSIDSPTNPLIPLSLAKFLCKASFTNSGKFLNTFTCCLMAESIYLPSVKPLLTVSFAAMMISLKLFNSPMTSASLVILILVVKVPCIDLNLGKVISGGIETADCANAS